MSDTSLRQIAQSLGSDNVGGMAQKVGLKWPPPPPVSVRSLAALATQNIIVAHRRLLDQNLNADQRISVNSYNFTDSGSLSQQSMRFITTLEGTGSATGPGLTIFQGRLFMAYRGILGDEGIWVSSSADGINWDPHQSINGIGSLEGPSLATFKGQLYMIYSGIKNDESVYWTWKTADSDWQPQQRIPDTVNGGSILSAVTF